MNKLFNKILVGLVLSGLLASTACSSISFGPPKEPVTIRYIYQSAPVDYTEMIEDFQKEYPHITVEVVQMSSLMWGGEQVEGSVDVVRGRSSYLNKELLDQVFPLDTYIETDPKFPANDYLFGTLEGLQKKNDEDEMEQMGIPAGIAPYVMFYEPDKFAIAGVELPTIEDGWTLEEFVRAAEAINQPEPDPFTGEANYGFCSTAQWIDPMVISYMYGGGLIDSFVNPGAPTLNTTENIDSLKWYANLDEFYGILPKQRNYDQLMEFITTSQCGFWMNFIDVVAYRSDVEIETTFLPLPTLDGEPFGFSEVDAYFIFKDSEHPQESWQWIRFLMDQEAASGMQITPRRSMLESKDYEAIANPDTLRLARQLPEDTLIMSMGVYDHMALGGMISEYRFSAMAVVDQHQDPIRTLNQAQAQVEQLFLSYSRQ